MFALAASAYRAIMRDPESPQKPRFLRASFRTLAALALMGALAACNSVVLRPAGDVARQQSDLVVVSTVLMLIIIVPVMALTVFFAWRYRASNSAAEYQPDWDHSTQLELVIWAAPLLIIICLGALTWVGTHLLDPYRAIGRLDEHTPVAPDARPLEIDVVALDWKWLFIYPEQGVATVNELVVPTGRPLQFRITSSSVMNSFYVPAMAGQIYAMPGMETRLHAVMNRPVTSVGFSANYSGAGFSNMRFPVRALGSDGFDRWIGEVRATGVKPQPAGRPADDVVPGDPPVPMLGGTLDRAAYLTLEKPSEKVPSIRFAAVDPQLYDAVVNMCVEPGKMCTSEMMAIDMRGGLGKAGIRNVSMLAYDKHGRQATLAAKANPGEAVRRELAWVRALCARAPGKTPDGTVRPPLDPRALGGAGLPAPGTAQSRAPASASFPLLSRN
ncbi:cytochrome ubiquinol oxidase subunit II [Novosphingobium colocasiae]|uniref:Ubiquinol oxidase polypeptide II n=2 Tax=Novosphingobium colocasiae TaxID=1256513 RepID=A0A918UG50_9SPHN|nr:cytochrome ubiquinol oxidase subunit II [Novosphingobium colocasiae]